MKTNRIIRTVIYSALCLTILLLLISITKKNIFNKHEIGDPIDSFNNISVYYNGNIGTNIGRNRSQDGYNYGLKYQCVEFVKRYYYDHLNHKMPNTYGHAKDFYRPNLNDGAKNTERNLVQFSNPSRSKPKINDIVVFNANRLNPFGHVAIVSNVAENEIEIIQQNSGRYGNSRATISLDKVNDKWKLDKRSILGWLRKKNE